MERINRLIRNEKWKALIARIEENERERVFCKHGAEHLFAVARIAALRAEDEKYELSRELIYAAALTHDLGRAFDGEEHAERSGTCCREILPSCGFDREETERIVAAVRTHRNKEDTERDTLATLLARADYESRNCFVCRARAACRWQTFHEEIDY